MMPITDNIFRHCRAPKFLGIIFCCNRHVELAWWYSDLRLFDCAINLQNLPSDLWNVVRKVQQNPGSSEIMNFVIDILLVPNRVPFLDAIVQFFL
jgi:hypothetical protein